MMENEENNLNPTPSNEPEENKEQRIEQETPVQEAPVHAVSNKKIADEHLVKVSNIVQGVKDEIGKVIVGQEETVDLLLAALFTNGHVLLEGVPGIAKTLLTKVLAKTLTANFSRIQFTPDLMPTDVLGTTIFNLKDSEFVFKSGPIFSNIILIDEINRAPAKTQAALFEVMEEFQVTYDGTTYPMSKPFFVMATQNPIEQEGTYSLPEAQLDRFAFKLHLSYPSVSEEIQILKRFQEDFKQTQTETVQPVLAPQDIEFFKKQVELVYIKDELIEYIAKVIGLTREINDLFLGASPRASLAILKTSKALALMNGRYFVTPDDIRRVSYPVLNHRILLSPEKEMEGVEISDVINDVLQKVEVPR
ncbi:MoxR family ATPase [Flammeovirgaceae bacterium SG7u.111]|nr:MoxR family ATPase [Flammeovirgaceae bacterium SG7u.132]WPO38450.1 MoxR family ATPase [Flammeovirgaceae bacterium SG7u.111]